MGRDGKVYQMERAGPREAGSGASWSECSVGDGSLKSWPT